MSAVAVVVGSSGDKTRQNMEQGSKLPAKADKLLGLHGPNNWITNFDQLLYRHNWLSTQPPVNSASSPMFTDSQISSRIMHRLQYKVYQI